MRVLQVLLLLLVLPWSAAAACPAGLRIAFLDTYLPPYLNGAGEQFEQPPGLLVDWTRSALKRLGCEAELLRLPQRRLLAELEAGAVQLAPGIGFNAERAQRFVFPLRADGSPEPRLSIGEARLSLFTVRDRRGEVHWDGQRLAMPRAFKVGVVSRGVEEPLALAQGWAVETSLNHALNAEKLRRGRLPLVLMPHLALNRAELARAPALVELQPPVMRAHFYAPAHRAFEQIEPAFVAGFWRELCRASRTHFTEMPACL
jgi:hypothetical protein